MSLAKLGGFEVLHVIDAVSRERSIPKELLFAALEDALQAAAKKKFGYEQHVKAKIDRKTGEIDLLRELLVVSSEEDGEQKKLEDENLNIILLEDAIIKYPAVVVDDIISEELPHLDIGRIVAQAAKQVINLRVREIERELQYEEFKGRIGEIVNGVVEKIERGNIIVKIGSAEAVLQRNAVLRGDTYKQGDRVKAYLVDLDPNNRGPQIILSRTHNQFVVKLFAQEVPEIYENIIQIKVVARDPGSRAKVAVFSSDSSVDPIGSCVGMRGSRVQAIIAELKGEKIDIINWTSNVGAFVINALAPATISKVIVYEDQNKVEVVVPDDQQSIAIGRQGQNVRLASDLIGWKIDILTEDNESKRRQDEFNNMTQEFMASLDLEEILAQLLASEGFGSIQELADVSVEDLMKIQGLDETIAQELVSRASKYMADKRGYNELAVPNDEENSPLSRVGVDEELAHALHEKGIERLIDLAELSRLDFQELLPDNNLDEKIIDEIIMKARKLSGMI